MFWLFRVVCDSFSVLLAHILFFLPLSDFHFWLLLRVASRLYFGSCGICARRCFVSFEVYCDCQCVPTLRGQPFKEIHDAGRTPKSTAVILTALWGSSGFPPRHEQACKFLVSSPSFLFSSLKPSEFPCQPSRWEREFCLCFSCRWSGRDVFAGQVFGDRQARVLRRPCLRDRPPKVLLAREEVDDGIVAASVVRSRGPPGGVVGVSFTILFPFHAMFASLPLVF